MKTEFMNEKKVPAFPTYDFGMYYCGQRNKLNKHIYGPEIRSHFLLVLASDGDSVIKKPRPISFSAHDLFVMFPGETVYYESKGDWSIQWVGLYGDSVEPLLERAGITRKNPVCNIERFTELSEILTELLKLSDDRFEASRFKCQSLLYDFFSILLSKENPFISEDTVSSAKQIIKFNYNTELTLSSLADRLHLNPTYFSRLFKEKTGVSPKQYILNVRIERAKQLLCSTDSTIKEISNSVGFSDPLYFSRVFSKLVGVSPLNYKKHCKN